MPKSTDLTEPSTMRSVGAKLAEMHPAILATSQSVAETLVILRKQEHRADVMEEAKRLRDEERWQEDEERQRDKNARALRCRSQHASSAILICVIEPSKTFPYKAPTKLR